MTNFQEQVFASNFLNQGRLKNIFFFFFIYTSFIDIRCKHIHSFIQYIRNIITITQRTPPATPTCRAASARLRHIAPAEPAPQASRPSRDTTRRPRHRPAPRGGAASPPPPPPRRTMASGTPARPHARRHSPHPRVGCGRFTA